MTAIDKVQYLQIGVQGDNNATTLEFDMTAWAEQYPDATFHILFKPYNETEVSPQVPTYDTETKVLSWTVGAGATAVVGVGYTEIRAQDGQGLVKKSRVIPTAVENSVSGAEVNPPAAYADWVTQVLNAGAAIVALSHGTEINFSIGTNGHLVYSYTDEDSETVTVDLGPVDAYGMAVEAGYERTRTQFENELAHMKDYSDLAEAAAEAAEICKNYAQTFVGAPRTAATADAMTDEDLIYVFTGTTTASLTNGHWYFWDGEAWSDGGVYNSTALTTDTTLTVSGAAADAKVTGDKLAEQKSALYTEITYSPIWAQGKWAVATGNYSTDTKLIRSYKYIPTTYLPNAVGFRTTDTYEFAIYCWKKSDETYMGSWTGSGFSKSSSTFYRRPVYFREIGNEYKFAINVRNRTTSTAITPAVATDMYFITTAFVLRDQGVSNAGKILKVGTDGITVPSNDLEEINDRIDTIESKNNVTLQPDLTYSKGCINDSGVSTNYKNRVVSSMFEVKIGDYVEVDEGYKANMLIYSKKTISSSYLLKKIDELDSVIVSDTDGYAVVQITLDEYWSSYSTVLSDTSYKDKMDVYIVRTALETTIEIQDEINKNRAISNQTDLVECQKAVATDWHFPFIDVANGMGLGNNYQIPGTASLWTTGSTDLTQKDIWMSDGTHPFKGDGVTDMYGLTIAQQLALVSPSFRNTVVSSSAPYWTGKTFLWMGTSIPAGSDPDAGQGTGATYPALVADYLGATTINKAKGSSCVRANNSAGNYKGFYFSHFIRSVTRMIAECDAIALDWDNIKTNISNSPDTLSESNISTMKNHSFENLILPYLNGTYTMPDLFVIDYGHNDVRPYGVDGGRDLWVKPTVQNIKNEILAPDTYMVANNYANLKLAMNNDLSGISNKEAFAASVNRNCLQGALNFLIMVIMSRNPYARIAIVSDFN